MMDRDDLKSANVGAMVLQFCFLTSLLHLLPHLLFQWRASSERPRLPSSHAPRDSDLDR